MSVLGGSGIEAAWVFRKDLGLNTDFMDQTKQLQHILHEELRWPEALTFFAQPGQMQAERDFNQQGEGSSPVRAESSALQ